MNNQEKFFRDTGSDPSIKETLSELSSDHKYTLGLKIKRLQRKRYRQTIYPF